MAAICGERKRGVTMLNKKNRYLAAALSAALAASTALLGGCRDAGSGEIILIGEAAEVGNQNSAAPDAAEKTESGPVSVRVYVCGAVVRPGVVEIPEGSRVEDALSAAGGLSPEAAVQAVNLADWVKDGQMIYFPTSEETGQMWGSSQGGSLLGGEQAVNINTADKALLCTLPGIGESRAADIIAYREAHGGFESCEELMQVSGIKAGIYEKLRDKITVR